MKALKNKVIEVHSKCKKFGDWVRQIGIVYWIILISILLAFFLVTMPSNLWNEFWINIKAQKHLAILVLIFCTITVSLVWKTGQRLDEWAFLVFNLRGRRARWLDGTMLTITQIGSGVFAVGIAMMYFLIGNQTFAYEIVLGSLSLWLVVELMKFLICRTRPYIKLTDTRIVGSRAGGHSFPSGHTSQSFFLAALFSNYYQFALPGWLMLFAVALLVSITRMYVGMHYPRDILGGSVLGTFWGLFGVILSNSII